MNPNQTLLNQPDVILPGQPFRKENIGNKLAKCCSYTNREFVGTLILLLNRIIYCKTMWKISVPLLFTWLSIIAHGLSDTLD